MVLPTGQISMAQVNTELSRASNQQISLGESPVRALAAKPSGVISMNDLRGKANAPSFNYEPGGYYMFPTSANPSTAIISSSIDVVWTYTKSGRTNRSSESVANGGTARQIAMSVTRQGTETSNTCTWSLTATWNGKTYSWTIEVTCGIDI